MKRDLLNKTIHQALGVSISIMMLIAAQTGWAQVTQSGGGSTSQSLATATNPQVTSPLRASSESPKINVPQIILTERSTALRTKTDDGTTSTSLVKIKDVDGNVSEPIEWDEAFPKIRQEGGSILLYQNVTLTNTDNILPSANCTIDGAGHELHYTQNDAEKTLVLDADITFKNIKLFDGLIAWGHTVVFESDVVLSDGYSVWGGEFRNENSTVSGKEDYVVNNTSITVKGGTFNNIYGGSSDDKITGSTNVVVEGGTIECVYGGNSHPDADDIPGDTHVTINKGTIGHVFGGGVYNAVKGTAYTIINNDAIITGNVYGGGHDASATVRNTSVIISGTVTGAAIGGGAAGNVLENTSLNLLGGSISGNTCGGGLTGTVGGTASVTISNSATVNYIFGGGEGADATCNATDVTVTGGTIKGWLYGGGREGKVTQTAKTDISGDTFNGSICGGGCLAGSTCGNTDMTLSNVSLKNNTWVYGGGEESDVINTAKVTVKSGTINKTVFGGAWGNAACGNTEVVIEGGTIGWVYGGGNNGSVTNTAKVTMSAGTINGNIYGGGWGANASCRNTEIIIIGGSQSNSIFGGGENGSVINDTQVTIENGQSVSVYGSGQTSTATVGGNVNIIVKGGSTQILGAANTTSTSSSITGTMNITIEGGETAFTGSAQIISGNIASGIYKDCTLTFKNCGTDASPYKIPTVYGISKIVMNNSFISKDPTGQANPAFMHNLSKPLIIEGTGMKGSFEIQAYEGQVTTGTTIVTAADLTTGATFTTNSYPLYKVGSTYRYGGTTPDYKTVNFTLPNAAIGTLSVQLSDGTKLESGDQVPANTELTIATTATGGNTLTVKNGDNTIDNGKFTVNTDVNLTVAIAGSLNLTDQSTDITISKESDQWRYLASDLKSTGTTTFNGIVTGTLPSNKTILIDGSAKGELIFDNIKVDAGSTGTAITIAQGANISIKGSLEAKTSDSAVPALANNGSVTTTTGASITAINSGDGTKGISVSDGAALLLTEGSTLKASGIDNNPGGTVVAQEGSTVSNSTSGSSDLLKTHVVTITNLGNGNTLTVKAGDIDVASGDKVTENTQLTIAATSAANYSLEKITVTPSGGNATEIANNTSYTMGTAAITIAASFKYNPPDVPPVTTYYTVTLPAVEGATLSKQAGDHTVEEGYSFTFTITLDEDYSESVPVVTTNRGETIKPDANGKYEINNVEKDIVISISGIVKNIPTDIEEVETGTKIWTADGTLFIRTSSPQQVQVVSLAGSTVLYRNIPAGDTLLEGLTAGVYIVRLSGNTVQKVMVR